MYRMREPLFRASTEHGNWDKKKIIMSKNRIYVNMPTRQTVEEKMAGLTGLLGPFWRIDGRLNRTFRFIFYKPSLQQPPIEHQIHIQSIQHFTRLIDWQLVTCDGINCIHFYNLISHIYSRPLHFFFKSLILLFIPSFIPSFMHSLTN